MANTLMAVFKNIKGDACFLRLSRIYPDNIFMACIKSKDYESLERFTD